MEYRVFSGSYLDTFHAVGEFIAIVSIYLNNSVNNTLYAEKARFLTVSFTQISITLPREILLRKFVSQPDGCISDACLRCVMQGLKRYLKQGRFANL